jgi:hypothetical protein
MERYQRNRFPADLGLTENQFLVRWNVDVITAFDKYWHRQYFNGSQRDHLSFMYCVWRMGVPLSIIPQQSPKLFLLPDAGAV